MNITKNYNTKADVLIALLTLPANQVVFVRKSRACFWLEIIVDYLPNKIRKNDIRGSAHSVFQKLAA